METKRNPLRAVEDVFSWIALIALALLPASETVARIFFKTGIPSSPLILSHLVLVVGLISGMITTREKEHLSIALVQYLPNDRLKSMLSILAT